MAIGFGACPEVGTPAPKVVEVNGDNALLRKAEILAEDVCRNFIQASIGQDAHHRLAFKLPTIDPEPIGKVTMDRQFSEALPVEAGQRNQPTKIGLGFANPVAVAGSGQRIIDRDGGDPPAIRVARGQLFVKAENVAPKCRICDDRREAILDMFKIGGV